MKNTPKFGLIPALIFILSLKSICATLPKYGGNLRVAIFQDSLSIDPIKISTPIERYISGNVFDGLVRYNGSSLIPTIVSSWEVSQDGLLWTFKLDNSVKFHNGRRVSASDVRSSWLRSLAQAPDDLIVESSLMFILGAEAYRNGRSKEVPGIKVLNEDTIQIELVKPCESFLEGLTAPAMWVTPRELTNKPEFNFQPVGSGPFKCVRGAKDVILQLEAYRDYVWGRPFLDKISFIYFADFESAMLQLEIQDGSVDCLELPNIEFRQGNGRAEQLVSIPNSFTFYLQINEKKLDRRFANIARSAIDVNSILQMINRQGSIILSSYNIDRAKKLLKEQYKDSLTLIVCKLSYDAINVANRIELDLSSLGIKTKTETLSPAEFKRAISFGTFSLALQLFSSAVYKSALLDNDRYIPLLHQNTNIIVRSNVFGLPNYAPNGVLQFDEVYLIPDQEIQ